MYFQIQFINVVCTHEIKEHIKGKLKSSRNLLCQKIKRRRLAKNKVTENFRHLNGEENLKKKKTEILNDDRSESFKNQICQKRKQRNTGNPEKGNPQQLNPENLKKQKYYLMIASNALKNKFGRDHIIYAQSVTEVSIGVLSVIFRLKIIMILK